MNTTSFRTLGVPAPLAAILAAQGKTEPFPIQVDTLPDTLAGRDVLGRGRTGSGKTLAFALPLVARLGGALAGGRRRDGRPLGLVLAPTRELATQIDAVIEPLAAAYGLSTTTIYGGINQKRQVDALRRGVDIIVACPGRLEDLIKQGFLTLDAIEITVLDEADHMADLGFLPVVTRIMDRTPKRGQRLLFSATLDNGVDKLVGRYLHDEVIHSVDEAHSPVAAMRHHVFDVADVDAKNELVRTLASGNGRRILFMRTKHHAKKLARKLTDLGIPAVDLHGNLSQPQRDRNLAAFGDGSVKVLVATDVAARGVHVDDVELVIHVDPPMEHKAYLHRSGRTARAGNAGDVVTICLPAQKSDLASILRKASITAVAQPVTASSPVVTELVGPIAERVEPGPREIRRGNGVQGGRTRGSITARNGGKPRSKRPTVGDHGEAPRRDRSGRPDAHRSGRATTDRASRATTDRASRPATARTNAASAQHISPAAPNRNRRTPNAQKPLRVGSLVQPNRGQRANRRAQG